MALRIDLAAIAEQALENLAWIEFEGQARVRVLINRRAVGGAGFLAGDFQRRELCFLAHMGGGDLVHRHADIDALAVHFHAGQPGGDGAVMEARLGTIRIGGQPAEEQQLGFVALQRRGAGGQCEIGALAGRPPAIRRAAEIIDDAQPAHRRAAAVLRSADRAGCIASRNGSASETDAPLSSARRDRCFLATYIMRLSIQIKVTACLYLVELLCRLPCQSLCELLATFRPIAFFKALLVWVSRTRSAPDLS